MRDQEPASKIECDFDTRGYVVLSAVKFVDTLSSSLRARALQAIPADFQQKLAGTSANGFCPASNLSVVLHALVAASDDDAAAFEALHRCGQFIAREATNTFLRLLIRLLTPRLFIKRLPTLLARDLTGGKVLVETLNDREVVLRFTGVGGFDHFGPASLGWVTFAIEQMGKTVTRRKCHPWSLSAPGPAQFSLEIGWTSS